MTFVLYQLFHFNFGGALYNINDYTLITPVFFFPFLFKTIVLNFSVSHAFIYRFRRKLFNLRVTTITEHTPNMHINEHDPSHTTTLSSKQ